MEISKLRSLAADARYNPHYHFRHLTEAELLDRATKSFKRLTDAQQLKAQKSWTTALDKVGEKLDENTGKELLVYRFLAQTNLFFLCQLLEKYSQVTLFTHEEICNEFFVQKDPAYITFEKFANQYTDKKDRLLLVPRGGFKALALDTEVATPTGFISIANIQVGDRVFDGKGKQCNVIGKSDVFSNRKCYKVTFSTGESVVSDAEHLWVTDARKDRDRLKGRNSKNKGPEPSVKSTQQIKDSLLVRGEHNHRVAIANACDYKEEIQLSIDPYVLGAWLGDGTSSCGEFTSADQQIIDEIQSRGQVIRKCNTGKYTYAFNGGPEHEEYKKRGCISFASKLRAQGLLNTKHIPQQYLRCSYQQRLDLLRGLMDTDGSCDERGHATFVNTNSYLVVQVRELIASLGLKPFDICEFVTSCDGYTGTAYSLGFKPYSDEVRVFNLTRKAQRQKPRGKVSLSDYRQIVSVEEVESVPTQCISVDSPDHTYLVTRSYITTHNSSIDIADCVQWITCYPAVTILILTGVYKLAGDFVGELRQHFSLEESGILDPKTNKSGFCPRKMMDRETGVWTDSLFQVLFPEHCITPNEGTSFEYQTPTGGDEKEPTVRAASIEQALSGMHFGVLKLDDVVTNENSQTTDRLNKTNKQISINRAMLHPYGFMDIIGTWYDEQDFYGVTLKQEEKEAEASGLHQSIKGTIDSGRFNSDVLVKCYLRAAWWYTEKAEKEGRIDTEAKKEDYVLWFPERLNYDFLAREKKKDEHFPIKYLNNPRQLHKVKFPRELLVRRTIPHNQLPTQGVVVTTVDTAYSTKSWADYTVILTALIFGGRFYIINMTRGRYNEYDLPAVIAGVAAKWKPKRVAIEDSMGVKWMGRELRREMDRLQVTVPVEFASLGLGSKRNSKLMKAKPVLRLLGDERMYLLNSCEGLQEIYSELEKFTGNPSEGEHDDIVSALSLMAEQFGAYVEMGMKVGYVDTQYVADQKSKAMHDMIYGMGAYARYAANANDDNPKTVFQTDGIRNQFGELIPELGQYDPFADLM